MKLNVFKLNDYNENAQIGREDHQSLVDKIALLSYKSALVRKEKDHNFGRSMT